MIIKFFQYTDSTAMNYFYKWSTINRYLKTLKLNLTIEATFNAKIYGLPCPHI